MIRPFASCDDSAVDCGRRSVVKDQTATPALARAVTGAEAGGRPAVPTGHPVRPASGHRLATPAAGAGVRLGTDVLAAPGPLAEGRSLRAATSPPARRAERG